MKNEANKSQLQNQEGITDKKQSMISQRKNKMNLPCLIKYNSPYKIFWNFVVSAAFVISFWLIPVVMCF